MTSRRSSLACVVAVALWAAGAWGAEAPAGVADVVAITGLVNHPQSLTRTALQAFPKKTLDVTFMTGHGEQKGTYTGARLWDVLKAAAIVDEGKNSQLRRTLTIVGRDGYTIVMSLSELDPDYGNHDALLAYARGTPPEPQDQLRLVIPSDRHGGRAVSDVVRIDVK